MRWRTVPNFSNYEVSEDGQVRRSMRTRPRSRGWSRKKPGDLLRPAIKGKKYPTLVLVRDDGKYCTMRAPTLVGTTFLGPRPKGKYILHKDDDGGNNHYNNLYWGTQKQNNSDMYRNGHGLTGEKHANCTITDFEVKEIRDLYSTGFFSQQAIANHFKISQSTVGNIVNKKRRTNVI